MAPRDPSKPQLDFPQLVADIIRQLNLTGTVGLLDFLDAVRPVYIVAARAGVLNVTANLPVFTSAEITDGSAVDPVANTVIGDTGALVAGDYDIWGSITFAGQTSLGGNNRIVLQHRNAGNNATLATLLQAGHTGIATSAQFAQLPLTGYSIGLNERLRFINPTSNVSAFVGTVIAVRLRPTP